ncbi:MAG: Ig-like domain-containing protein [Saprospiraceae bacterium]
MKKRTLAFTVIALTACARPVLPEGGPKDTTPPQVVQEKSTPNNTTRFEGRSFQLTFDEWVTLNDVGTQVLVSPPLAKRPEVSLRGRTVTFQFDKDEVLRQNTTYTINFGAAVKDLHESIPAKDLRFVFSTGEAIDSLSVSGTVVDAFSGEPVENIAVLLHDRLDDSVVRQERPYYFSRTDKIGQFLIPNVRAGIFKCTAIEDTDHNLKWSGDNERIGFAEKPLPVSDTSPAVVTIRMFTNALSLRLASTNTAQYGLVRLGFSSSPDTVALRPDRPGLRWLREQEQDTLLVWYDNPDSTAWKLLVGLADTVPLRALSRSAFLEQNKVLFGEDGFAAGAGSARPRGRLATATSTGAAPPRTINVQPGKPARIPFNSPVTNVDTSRCLLRVDSADSQAFVLQSDSSSQRSLLLDRAWQAGQRCTLSLLPGAITNFWGTTNTDTLRRIFVVPTEKQLGSLGLALENLQPGMPLIVRLMNANTLVEERAFTPVEPTARFVFPGLEPAATYSVQLIEDRNGNRRWDSGDYFANRQPEQVLLQKLEQLRANWEMEVAIQAEFVKTTREKPLKTGN